jgi:hypothetical protein
MVDVPSRHPIFGLHPYMFLNHYKAQIESDKKEVALYEAKNASSTATMTAPANHESESDPGEALLNAFEDYVMRTPRYSLDDVSEWNRMYYLIKDETHRASIKEYLIEQMDSAMNSTSKKGGKYLKKIRKQKMLDYSGHQSSMTHAFLQKRYLANRCNA